MWESLEKEGAFIGVVKLQTKKGKSIWIELATSRIIEEDIDSKKYMCIGFDVSELILKEQRIESLLHQARIEE